MNTLESYKIDLRTLKNEDYAFEFAINDSFFQALQTDLLEKGALIAKVHLRKSDLMLHLTFDIEGMLELACDRSLELFDYPIALHEQLILQFGDTEESLDDDLEIIPHGTQIISLVQYLYEYLVMAVPMKKLHPKFQEEIDEDDCDVKLIYSSSTDQQDAANEEDTYIDPRWAILKNLKN